MIGLERLPVFVDLAYGIVGMWAGYEETSQEGMVIPKYYPHNTMQLVKPKKYPSPVPEEAIFGPRQPSGKASDIKGIPPQVVVVTNTVEGQPLLQKIDTDLGKNIDRLRRQLEEQQWRTKSERRKRKETEDEMESEKRDKQSRGGGRKRRQDGERPSFLNK